MPNVSIVRLALAGVIALTAMHGAWAQAQQPQQPASPRPPARQPAQQPAQPQQPQAQQQQQAPPPPEKLAGFSSGWARVCQQIQGTTQQGCIVSQEVFQESGAFMASVAYQETQGEARKQLIVITPLGLALQSGLLIRVDDNNALLAKYGTCLQNGCFGGIDVGDDLLRPMRTGTNLFLTVRTAQGQALDLTIPLQGFAQALDGPPMEQAALQERQRKFQEEIVRRQEETRRRLQESQQQQQPRPPGAPGQPGAGAAPPATPQR